MGLHKDREKLSDSDPRPSNIDHRCFSGCTRRSKREYVVGIRDLISRHRSIEVIKGNALNFGRVALIIE